MGFSGSAKRWKREAVPAAFAALTFVTLCFSACPSPLDHSSTSASSGATAALTVSFSIDSSRTVTASSGDLAAAIQTMSVAIVDGSLTTVAEATGIAYGTGVVKTFGSLPPGTYTIKVNAYDATNALIATGWSTVTVAANTNKNVTVDLAYSQGGTTGGLSLELSWPRSTGLADVTATIDGAAVTVSAVAVGVTDYTATLTASNLAGGARLLSIYFRTAAGATTAIGPFIETVNIWDGVTSACWIDAGGNPVHTRSFDATEFSASNADLAALTFTGANLTGAFAAGTTSYALTNMSAATFSFAATSISGSQDVKYFWNNNLQTWNTSGTKIFNSQNLTWVAGDNTLKIVVTAADRQTTRTYTITAPPVVTNANLTTAIAANPSGSFTLAENATVTATITAPFNGTLDGNGHTLTLGIPGGSDNAGLFKEISASGTVKNLLVAGSVAGNSCVGSIAALNKGTITNCTTSATVSGTSYVGGLTGNNTGQISNSSSTGTVVGGSGSHTGGISGMNNGTLYRCYTAGDISSTSGSEVGGLAGWNWTSVSECYSVANVHSASGLGTGGLVGSNLGTISNSYARGPVSGPAYIGGITGDNRGTVAYCYATGSVTGAAPRGELVYNNASYPTNIIITDSYTSTSGVAYYLASLGTAVPGTWSLSIWTRDPAAGINGGYPYLPNTHVP